MSGLTFVCWDANTDEDPGDVPWHKVESCDPEFAAAEFAEKLCGHRAEYAEAMDDGMHIAVRGPEGDVTHWRVHAEQSIEFSARAFVEEEGF